MAVIVMCSIFIRLLACVLYVYVSVCIRLRDNGCCHADLILSMVKSMVTNLV